MEFEFTRNTLMGEYYVKCSIGHEICWPLASREEIGKIAQKLDHVMALIRGNLDKIWTMSDATRQESA